MVSAVAQALELGTDHRTDATRHTTPGRATTLWTERPDLGTRMANSSTHPPQAPIRRGPQTGGGLQLPVGRCGVLPDSWMNRLRLTGAQRRPALAFGNLLIDAAQGPAGPVSQVLVVDDLSPPYAVRAGIASRWTRSYPSPTAAASATATPSGAPIPGAESALARGIQRRDL